MSEMSDTVQPETAQSETTLYKHFEKPDLADFGDGEVGIFDYVAAKYLWSELEAGKEWIVGLDDPAYVVVAVLKGTVKVLDENGKNPLDDNGKNEFAEGAMFAVRKNRRICAVTKATLFAAPLVNAVPPEGEDTLGNTVMIRGNTVMIRGDTVMIRGNTVMIRGDTIIL
jgi:hypothetical protein